MERERPFIESNVAQGGSSGLPALNSRSAEKLDPRFSLRFIRHWSRHRAENHSSIVLDLLTGLRLLIGKAAAHFGECLHGAWPFQDAVAPLRRV